MRGVGGEARLLVESLAQTGEGVIEHTGHPAKLGICLLHVDPAVEMPRRDGRRRVRDCLDGAQCAGGEPAAARHSKQPDQPAQSRKAQGGAPARRRLRQQAAAHQHHIARWGEGHQLAHRSLASSSHREAVGGEGLHAGRVRFGPRVLIHTLGDQDASLARPCDEPPPLLPARLHPAAQCIEVPVLARGRRTGILRQGKKILKCLRARRTRRPALGAGRASEQAEQRVHSLLQFGVHPPQFVGPFQAMDRPAEAAEHDGEQQPVPEMQAPADGAREKSHASMQ